MNQKGIGSILGLVLIMVLVIVGVSYFIGRGSGNLTTETREVSGFDRISLSGTGNLIITQGETESLSIEAEDNIVDKITTEVSGETLEISYKHRWPFWPVWPTKEVNLTITLKSLESVKISGSGSASCDNLVGDSLNIEISGSGKIDMAVELSELTSKISGTGEFIFSGTTETQSLEISGSGKYYARDLASKIADIKISGSGNAEVSAEEKLNVEISGSGNVKYLGSPSINQKISGSGTVEELK